MTIINEMKQPLRLLSQRELQRLHTRERHVRSLLRQAGLSKKRSNKIVHRDVRNVFERRSSASPYEALRSTFLLTDAVRKASLTSDNGFAFTVSILQHRPQVGTLLDYQPSKALRKFREAMKKLKDMGLQVMAICVLEIDLCRPLGSAPFYEIHLHGVVWGATKPQLKKAFIVRKLAKGAVRNRPTKFLRVSDLNGWISYITKMEAWVHVQPAVSSSRPWPSSRLPDADALEWRMFMSRYRVDELVKSYGIDIGTLGIGHAAELLVDHRDLSSRRSNGGPKGPSRHRKSP